MRDRQRNRSSNNNNNSNSNSKKDSLDDLLSGFGDSDIFGLGDDKDYDNDDLLSSFKRSSSSLRGMDDYGNDNNRVFTTGYSAQSLFPYILLIACLTGVFVYADMQLGIVNTLSQEMRYKILGYTPLCLMWIAVTIFFFRAIKDLFSFEIFVTKSKIGTETGDLYNEMSFYGIQKVDLSRSILGRMFNYGTLKVYMLSGATAKYHRISHAVTMYEHIRDVTKGKKVSEKMLPKKSRK